MHVDERTLQTVASRSLPAGGWFAAKQPGVIRFLEDRLRGDALAVALHGARIIAAAFGEKDGVAPPRLTRSLLERAEAGVVAGARSRRHSFEACAVRQPALLDWLAGLVSDPPLPLARAETAGVARCLASVIYGFDQLTTGRGLP